MGFLWLSSFKFREGSFEALLNTLNRINIYDEGTQTQLGSGHQMALNGDEMMRWETRQTINIILYIKIQIEALKKS